MYTDNNLSALNALLSKSKGDIANLLPDEVVELQQLTSKHLSREFRALAEQYYPKQKLITALLKEEMHRRRVSQSELCELLGMGVEYFNKVFNGRTNIGLQTAIRIHKRLGIDANYIMDIA